MKESEKGAAPGSDKVDRAVRQTLRDTVAALQKSPVLAEPLGSGHLKIVGAHYSLDSGVVEFFV